MNKEKGKTILCDCLCKRHIVYVKSFVKKLLFFLYLNFKEDFRILYEFLPYYYYYFISYFGCFLQTNGISVDLSTSREILMTTFVL